MSKRVILKSYIGENIDAPHKDLTILISHGSGGIGLCEYNTAEYFCQLGYPVILLDYFTPMGVEKLWWNNKNNNIDNITKGVRAMLTDFDLYRPKNYVHIGFSLGGFAGLLNSHRFALNFSFYPGIFGYTQEDLKKDYSNSTVIIAEHDNWCDNYDMFEQQCTTPPNKIIAKGCYHGFMLPDKDRVMPIVKYNFPTQPIDETTANIIALNHNQLTELYGYEVENIRLQSNQCYSKLMLEYIKEQVLIYENSTTDFARTKP
jgi:hypothetical protein